MPIAQQTYTHNGVSIVPLRMTLYCVVHRVGRDSGSECKSGSLALSLPARQAGGPAVAGRASNDNCSNSVPLALSTHPKITNLHQHNTEDRYLYKLIERFKGIVRGHRGGCGGEEGVGGYFLISSRARLKEYPGVYFNV